MADYGGPSDAAIRITDSVGADTWNIYIQCLNWDVTGQMKTDIQHLAGNTSFSPRVGEGVQTVKCQGRLVFSSLVGIDDVKDKLDELRKANVAPVYCVIQDQNGNYFPFMDNTGTSRDYLAGYPVLFNIKHVNAHAYIIRMHRFFFIII